MIKNIRSPILLTLLLWLITGSGIQASDPGFAPFKRSLSGLEDFWYIKQALKTQSHKGAITKISSTQAIKAIRSASPLVGFEYTGRVQDFLDFYASTENRRGVEIMLGISEPYLQLFEAVLKELEMPADLMYLPMALSSLSTRAVSDWGASGLWQMMFTNGKLYNLQIDSYVDERRDPVKSTRAALLYLKDLFEIYDNWELAIAAYSSSPSNINKAIRKAGGSKKYTDLYPWLPAETRDYLPAFTACYILMNQIDKTGLKPYQIEVPDFSRSEQVTKRLHLGQVAEVLDIPLALLQDMNPEFKNSIIPAGSREYSIKLPSDKRSQFVMFSDSIYNFKDTVYFRIRQTYVVSDVVPVVTNSVQQQSTPAQTASAPATNIQHRTKLTYTVKDGDNLGYISQWYSVGVSDIRQWNGLRGDIIRVGQALDIWVPNGRVSHFSGIDGMTFEQKQRHSGATPSTTQSSPAPAKPTSTSAASTGFTWYTVKSGDNPTSIAARYPGVTAEEIMKLNNITDPRNLRPGQRIKIPKK